MIKIKYLLLLVCIAGCFAACKKNEKPFDDVAQFQIDTAAIRSFVKAKGLNVLKSEKYGIFYQIIEPGTGNATFDRFTIVNADYEGRFLDGTVFDSGTNIDFSLEGVIQAWQFAVPEIQKGGTIRFITPSFYAYKNFANDRIPANSILDFTVTIKNITQP
ncbi:MAG TPA: FKBP-type peptidyl-prolyl cis-trans isomerase [Pedobacter sp.]|uniref:FKBP-type peptidyl-prolyl cis-trans isomerase n=1 Tax=Pedobacter sp. TaxID=1411316 RepID=UPI002D197995|nr:FKBP-type peptidyl-prolyl cis-trans isomerase [Pedobacter sp.]HMI05765.1 FKBP-type peptidyl-prolyl cis-trans isomerase [Pedobacter sp.]